MAQQIGGVTRNVVALPFYKTNIADANGTLNSVEPTTNEYVMPVAGSIIGFSGGLNATFTTGTLTFQPTVNGSLCPALPDAASVRTNQQRSSYMQEANRSNYTFSAGQYIGVHYNKADTINPTTVDGAFLVYVLLEDVRY